MRGDLILYETDHSLGDTIIAWGTHGPFVHVEIDLGDGTLIGANNNGITRTPDAAHNAWVIPILDYTTHDQMEKGLEWAMRQLGQPYGYIDIFNDSLKFLGIPLVIGQPRRLDCSDYATRYLNVAGASGPLGDLAQYPQSVSPNDLARAYHIKA